MRQIRTGCSGDIKSRFWEENKCILGRRNSLGKGMRFEILKKKLKSPFLNLSCSLIYGPPADTFWPSRPPKTLGMVKVVPGWTFSRHTLWWKRGTLYGLHVWSRLALKATPQHREVSSVCHYYLCSLEDITQLSQAYLHIKLILHCMSSDIWT